jgi:hypothetical protein
MATNVPRRIIQNLPHISSRFKLEKVKIGTHISNREGLKKTPGTLESKTHMRLGNNLQEINLPIRVRLEISSASGEQGRRRGGLSFQFKSLSLRNKRIHGGRMRTVHQEETRTSGKRKALQERAAFFFFRQYYLFLRKRKGVALSSSRQFLIIKKLKLKEYYNYIFIKIQ